jgi:hypothetical protein
MLVFMDESGDSGMKGKIGSSPFFVVTCVTFEDADEALGCEERIRQVREDLRLRPASEFHFNSCSHDVRVRFLKAVSPSEFFYHSIVLNKSRLWGEGFKYKSPFYKYTTGLVFENMKPHLRRATVVLDRCGNREFRSQLAKYLKARINDSNGDLIRRVKMQDSKSNDLLQLADMACGAVARSYARERKNFSVYRDIIQHRELHVQVWPPLM